LQLATTTNARRSSRSDPTVPPGRRPLLEPRVR
jgi:hypothetical protein